jgi:hypothetical protein
MWLVGASIALAGMWTYVAWGRVREPLTFELASLTHSLIPLARQYLGTVGRRTSSNVFSPSIGCSCRQHTPPS